MSLVHKIKYLLNDSFNEKFIKEMGIPDASDTPPHFFQVDSWAKKHSEAFSTVWLLNIRRLIKASRINPEEFNFLDVGCGKAISIIFTANNFNFKSYSGFNFERNLLAKARKNISAVNLSDKISLFEAEASELILPQKKYFLFMFNPFDGVIMKGFLKNNIKTLKEFNSVLGYANARELDCIKSFNPQKIISLHGYKSSVIFF